MKISLEWLKKHIDLDVSAEELERVLPMVGHEVDEVEYAGLPPLPKVVVGEVKVKEQHPDADRLSVCQVQVGEGESDIKQIVCGATNFKEGDRVPVALVGAKLPGDFKIKKSKLRGVKSMGMMCSPVELGLGAESKGLMILEDRPEVGTSINDVFSGGDVVLDLELTANRGDCASHRGVAQELGAYYGKPLTGIEVKEFEIAKATSNEMLKGLVVETKNCPYYTAWFVKGVKIGPSPEWLQSALLGVGLRPVNNVVDITNYIMMDVGQPLHAFDLAKIGGQKIVVRQAVKGEKITTLDEKKHDLDEGMMVIADEKAPMVIAGIMGSLVAEVNESTVDIVLESAYFDVKSIRATARKLGIHTDSGYRFARDVDPEGVVPAARRALELILEIAGGELVSPGMKVGAVPRGVGRIEISPDFVRDRIGFDVEDSEVEGIYKRLGFEIEKAGAVWNVTIPTARSSEVVRPIDLVEEFIRIYGTDKIPSGRVVSYSMHRQDDRVAVFNHEVSDYLVGQGFAECYHYSLVDGGREAELFGDKQAEGGRLENPLTADHTHLRASVLTGLLDGLKYNQSHGNDVKRLFELGQTCRVVDGKLHELVSVGFVIALESHARSWLERETVDFYNAKRVLQEIGAHAGLKLASEIFEQDDLGKLWQDGHAARVGGLGKESYSGSVGLCDMKLTKEWGIEGMVYAGELVMLPSMFKKRKEINTFKAFSGFPGSTKDISLVMEEGLPAELVRQEVEGVATGMVEGFGVESVDIFDVYRGKGLEAGKKSLGFSIKFRAEDRTLKDGEVMKAFEGIQGELSKDTRFTIRS